MAAGTVGGRGVCASHPTRRILTLFSSSSNRDRNVSVHNFVGMPSAPTSSSRLPEGAPDSERRRKRSPPSGSPLDVRGTRHELGRRDPLAGRANVPLSHRSLHGAQPRYHRSRRPLPVLCSASSAASRRSGGGPRTADQAENTVNLQTFASPGAVSGGAGHVRRRRAAVSGQQFGF